jgi:hypothetical protein
MDTIDTVLMKKNIINQFIRITARSEDRPALQRSAAAVFPENIWRE